MIRQNVRDAIKECEKFQSRAKEWLRVESLNDEMEEDDETIYNPASKVLRVSQDLSDALVRMRKNR